MLVFSDRTRTGISILTSADLCEYIYKKKVLKSFVGLYAHMLEQHGFIVRYVTFCSSRITVSGSTSGIAAMTLVSKSAIKTKGGTQGLEMQIAKQSVLCTQTL